MFKKTDLIKLFPFHKIYENREDQVLAFTRGEYLFVFNINPEKSFTNYQIPADVVKYQYVLSTDELSFGGFGRLDEQQRYFADYYSESRSEKCIKVYIPSRVGLVLKRISTPGLRDII